MSQQVIEPAFTAMVQSQMIHWKTKSPHVHKVLGDFYSEIQEAIDVLAEASIVNNEMYSGEFNINVSFDESLDGLIAKMITCKDTISDLLESENSQTVIDAYIGMLKLIDNTIYLLGMSDD